ncbi:MAG: hypothetical protein R2747_20915 [Pyrinomonadaceae bacterium]
MKKLAITSFFGLALAIALGFGFIPATEQTASCAECQTDNLPKVKKAFLDFAAECAKKVEDGEEQPKKCFIPNIYNKLVPILKALSKDGRYAPGERILLVGETQNGNLLAGTDRDFQMLTPSPKNSMTVEINKTDGGNGALIKICTVDDDGNFKRVGTINFPQNNETGKKSVTVNGIEGKIIRISINSTGGVLKKFKYTLKTSQ